jgi:site-specific DNA-methyltransferase (adenine-specific)
VAPYYQSPCGRAAVHHGDCLEVLASLPAGGFAAVVTDPPYGQTNEGYDRGVVRDVWGECLRACADGSALLSFAGNPTYHVLAAGIADAGWKIKQMWAWIYKDGLITSAYPKEGFDRLAPAMTPFCYAGKGKVILPLEREGEAWVIRHERGDTQTFSGRSSPNRTGKASGHWPKSVVCTDGVEGLQYFALSNNAIKHGDAHKHSNRKPLCLMEWLVGKVPAGRVLDPYTGSGTTGVAALSLGRSFTGIEADERYCEMAARRLEEALAGGPPPAPPPPITPPSEAPRRAPVPIPMPQFILDDQQRAREARQDVTR